MPPVEGNESIEESFNKILKAISPNLVALLCYCLPAMLMLSSADYHRHNVFVVLFFSLIIGTGFYGYYRNHAVLKAFFSNDRPVHQVVRDIRAQGTSTHSAASVETDKLTAEEESDWGIIVTQLEKSMEMDEDSDSMNLSTLFDRAESEQATLPQPQRASWLKRLFRRK